jgi:hypothetical protein
MTAELLEACRRASGSAARRWPWLARLHGRDGLEGEALLACVGSYRIEGMGAQLFEAVDGDYFTVLGLPLWPVLAELRRAGVLRA